MNEEREIVKRILNEIGINIIDSDIEIIAEILHEFGRKKKKDGARSYSKLVKKMRQKQTEYFRFKNPNSSRKQDLLRESKSLEEQVDRANKVILKD